MSEMKEIYDNLRKKRREIKERLEKKRKERSAFPGRRQSIIIKQIHGNLYYYAQWRESGRVKSRFLAPAAPGAAAAEEAEQEAIGRLENDIKELEIELKNLDKMIEYLDRNQKKGKRMEAFTFEVYWKDELTARVYVKEKEVIVSRYTDHPAKQLFAAVKMTRYQLGEIFKLRCWEKGRQDIHQILGHLGLAEYNPYEIVRKTHGVSYNDYIWFRFPGEKLTSKDVLVR